MARTGKSIETETETWFPRTGKGGGQAGGVGGVGRAVTAHGCGVIKTFRNETGVITAQHSECAEGH